MRWHCISAGGACRIDGLPATRTRSLWEHAIGSEASLRASETWYDLEEVFLELEPRVGLSGEMNLCKAYTFSDLTQILAAKHIRNVSVGNPIPNTSDQPPDTRESPPLNALDRLEIGATYP